MKTKRIYEPMKGITGKVIAKRFKGGTMDKVQPLFNLATTYKRRAAWLEKTMLAGLAKRWQRKCLELEARAEQILQSNFLGIGAETDNLVVTSSNHGRNLVCQRLAGVNTYSLNITHIELGDDNTDPTTADQDLGNGLERGTVTTYDISNNVLTLRFFLSDAQLADDTYEELGLFIDGTATLGSGQMWNHALFNYVKATGEDTTIEVIITVN